MANCTGTIRFWLTLILCIVSLGCERSGLGPGEFAPQFELEDLDGNAHKLRDYRGKTVLLNFWATWCAPCVAEVQALNQLHTQWGGEKFMVLSISEDTDLQTLKDFKNEHNVIYPTLFDRSKKALEAYRVSGFPESFVIDRFGKLSLVPDFQTGEAAVRLVGPRAWAELSMLEGLKAVINR